MVEDVKRVAAGEASRVEDGKREKQLGGAA